MAFLFLLIPAYFLAAFFAKIWPFAAKKVESTSLGIWLEGIAITSTEKEALDGFFQWAKQQGLARQPKDITVNVVEGKNFTYMNIPNVTGCVIGFDPIRITIARQVPHVLKHELVHVIIKDLTGDADAPHANELWKKLMV